MYRPELDSSTPGTFDGSWWICYFEISLIQAGSEAADHGSAGSDGWDPAQNCQAGDGAWTKHGTRGAAVTTILQLGHLPGKAAQLLLVFGCDQCERERLKPSPKEEKHWGPVAFCPQEHRGQVAFWVGFTALSLQCLQSPDTMQSVREKPSNSTESNLWLIPTLPPSPEHHGQVLLGHFQDGTSTTHLAAPGNVWTPSQWRNSSWYPT